MNGIEIALLCKLLNEFAKQRRDVSGAAVAVFNAAKDEAISLGFTEQEFIALSKTGNLAAKLAQVAP